MMKKIFALLLCATITMGFTVNSSADVGLIAERKGKPIITGVNGFEWGTNMDTVIRGLVEKGASESDLGLLDGGNSLYALNQNVSNLKCTMNYYFTDNALTAVLYYITENHTSENMYITDYLNLNEVYEQVYGRDEEKHEYWDADTYKNDPDKKGLAVSLGELRLVSQWKDPDGPIILHSLSGDNYKIVHQVYYSSTKLTPPTNTDGV